MMKFKLMLMLLLSIFLAGSYAGVVLVEDFESGVVGDSISTDGWYKIAGASEISTLQFTDAWNGGYGISARPTSSDIQAGKDVVNTVTDSDEDVYVKMVMTTGSQIIRAGLKSPRPGLLVTIDPVNGGVSLTPANYAAAVAVSYPITNNTTYEVVVQMKNISHGNTGSVMLRNISTGETEYTAIAGLQDIPMNFMHTTDYSKPSTMDTLWVRGQFNGWWDYFEYGTGIAPEPSPVVAFDDFEGGTLGASLSTDGWYAIPGTDIAGLVAQNSTLSGFGLSGKVSNANMQAKKDIVNTITNSVEDIYAMFTVTTGNQPMFFGVWGSVRPGFYLSIFPDNYIKLQPANWATVIESTDDYTIAQNTSYEFVVQMKNISFGGTGSVKVRNLSTGELQFTDLEGLQDVSMSFNSADGFAAPSDFAAFFLRGAHNGYFDYLELGTGMAPIDTGEKVVWASEDFEAGTVGNDLTSDGWANLYSTLPAWVTGNGDNGTKSAVCDPTQPDAQYAKTFADPNDFDELENEANIYFEVDITPKKWPTIAQAVRAGVFSIDSAGATRPGLYLGFSKNVIDNTKWDIYFHNAINQAPGTPNMEWVNSDFNIVAGNTYRFHVQITNNSTGSVYIKNLSLNEPCWTAIANMQNLPMGFSTLSKPKLFRRWYIRGSYAPHQIDNFELGTGLMSECDVYCDPALSGLAGDLNGDCSVGMDDLYILASGWMNPVPANLITNGDFSQLDAGTGLPVGWNYVNWGGDGDPAGQMYCQVVDGQLAQMMEKGIPNGYFGVYQVINVVPGRDYTINANWSGSTVDKGWAEILVYSVSSPNPTIDDLYQLPAEGSIVAKHDGFGDASAAFGTESITAAMYHEHCLIDPVNGGTNVRTATTPYLIVRTNLGSTTPDSAGGIHELYIDDVVVTGAGAPDVSGDGNVNLIDFAVIADEWLTEAMGPY